MMILGWVDLGKRRLQPYKIAKNLEGSDGADREADEPGWTPPSLASMPVLRWGLHFVSLG
jgi:hypothetical protein